MALFILVGCAGPLTVKYNPGGQPAKIKSPVTVYVEPFADVRTDRPSSKDPRLIGDITVLVADLNGNRLILSEEPSVLVTNAFEKELALSGFTVKSEADRKEADYILKGEIKDFRLDIGPRDKIKIEIASRLYSKKADKPVWEGTVSEKDDRFAGVMGNTRKSISDYISFTLQKVARKTVQEAGSKLSEEKAVSSPLEQGIPQGSGRLVITTDPPRAKIYINGVYYGVTPFTLDIEPGIYDVDIKQQGFKDGKEKVAVRLGRTTELELTLEKESPPSR